MEFTSHSGRCEGALHFQNNSSDVMPSISISRQKTDQFAASFMQKNCTTPVCGKSVDENSGSCKECYTAYPVDVNRAQDGTKLADNLNARLDSKGAVSLMLQGCQDTTFDVEFARNCLNPRGILYEQAEAAKARRQLGANLLSSRMVAMQIEEDAKKDSDMKNGCANGGNNWRGDASTKWLANDVLESALDINMENFVVLDNELLTTDSNCRTRKEYFHENVFDSPSGTEDVNWSLLNSSLLNNDFTKDVPPDLNVYLGVYTDNAKNTHLVADDHIESWTDSRAANETQTKEGQRVDEIRLLTEALTTRSFAPIAYLLSLLTKDSSGFLTGTTLESCAIPRPDLRSSSDDDASVTSPSLSNQSRRFSSQDSCDSDHSSVLSDGRFGKTFSQSDFSGALANGNHNSGTDQSLDFLTRETDRTKSEDLSENSNESDVVRAIDDILTSNTACSLQIFQELLDRDCIETPATNHRQSDRYFTTKVWKEASTETNRLFESNDDFKDDNKQQIARNQINNDNQADFDELKINKQPAQRVGPNRCYHLWDFLRELLDNNCSNVVVWTDVAKNEFKLIDTKLLADLWGQKKKLPKMNYDKLSRSLRYYIKLDILRKVPGKRLHFQFGNGRMWKKMKK